MLAVLYKERCLMCVSSIVCYVLPPKSALIKNIFDTLVQAVLTATVTYKMPYIIMII